MNVQSIGTMPAKNASFKGTESQTELGKKLNIDKKKAAIGLSAAAAVTIGAIALYKHHKTPKAIVNSETNKVFGGKTIKHMIDLVRTNEINQQIAKTDAHLQPGYRASRLASLQEAFAPDNFENQIVYSREDVIKMMEEAAQSALQKAA